MSIQVKSFSGTAMLLYLEDLAKLRIEVFRAFPYLYDGNIGYEQQYLHTIANALDSVVVVAFDGNKVVGVSTGMPLVNETPAVQKPFLDKGYDVSKIFYFGESVLQKAYRGKGIGVTFFEQREAHARRLNQFETLTFCSVIRSADHPLRPADHVPLDSFWKKRGFEPMDMICYLNWKEIDEAAVSPKQLRFWMKEIL